MANARMQTKSKTHMMALGAALAALLALGAIGVNAASGPGQGGADDGAAAARVERVYEIAGDTEILGETPECEGSYRSDGARAELRGVCEGLEPDATYTVRINGMSIGSFMADAVGGGSFDFRTDKDSPVPADSADDDVLALVDAGGMPIAMGGWEIEEPEAP